MGRASRPWSVMAGMRIIRTLFVVSPVFLLLVGCAPPGQHLMFPEAPCVSKDDQLLYDVDHDGRPDFGLLRDPATGNFDTLAYDDDEDGRPDRLYHLRDYDNAAVPHLIILLDSTPFEAVVERIKQGGFSW